MVDVAVLPDWVVEAGWVSLDGHSHVDASDISDEDVTRWVNDHSGTGRSVSVERAVDAVGELAVLSMPKRQGARYPTMTRAIGRFLTDVQHGRCRVDVSAALNEIRDVYVDLYPPGEQRDATMAFRAAKANFIRSRIAEDSELPSPRVECWSPVNLTAVAAGGLDPIEPDVFFRRDGRALFYSSKLNVVFGAPEAGKTWVAVFAIAALVTEAVQDGGGVVAVFIDYEDDARSYLTRLECVGIDPVDAATHTRYYSMARALSTAPDDIEGMDVARLVVVDSTNSAMTLDNLDPLSNADALRFIAQVRTLRRRGDAAWLLLDHEPISTTSARRQAIGAQSKLGAVDGAQYRAVAVEQPRPRANGVIALYVTKDRAGGVREHASTTTEHGVQHAATIHMEPAPGTVGDRFEVEIHEPDGTDRDVELRVIIIVVCNNWLSKKQIQTEVRSKGVSRRSTDIVSMINALANDSVLDTRPKGNYVVYKSRAAGSSDIGKTLFDPPSSAVGKTDREGTGVNLDGTTVSGLSEYLGRPGTGQPIPASRPPSGKPGRTRTTSEIEEQ